MRNILICEDKTIWWIIPDNKHKGFLQQGQQVTSIYQFEIFESEKDWLIRLEELDIEIEIE